MGKNQTIWEKIFEGFIVFELFLRFLPHPEPGALTGLSHAPNHQNLCVFEQFIIRITIIHNF
jgi:hypothetical protein